MKMVLVTDLLDYLLLVLSLYKKYQLNSSLKSFVFVYFILRGGKRVTVNAAKDIHWQDREIIINTSLTQQKASCSRSDKVLLARLRTGHHYAFRKYLNRLDPSIDPKCPLCKEDEHSLEHWLIDCPGISQERMNLFGSHRGQLSWLSSHPLKSVALAKMTLLGESSQGLETDR